MPAWLTGSSRIGRDLDAGQCLRHELARDWQVTHGGAPHLGDARGRHVIQVACELAITARNLGGAVSPCRHGARCSDHQTTPDVLTSSSKEPFHPVAHHHTPPAPERW